MADPFEEFEFKPLTEGLGFHKKNKKPAPQPEISFISNSSLDILDDEDKSPLEPPLPREIPRETLPTFNEPVMDDSSAAVEEILQTLRTKKVESPEPNVVPKTAPIIKYGNSVQNISAFFLDSMLVVAATLLCMIVVLSITKADATSVLFNSENGLGVYLSTAALFAMVSFVYLVVHRIFLGATPGEWAYDQRIGAPEELGKIRYALGVTWRSLLIILTGIIILPLISMITRRDVAGQLSGTQLMERV